MSSMALMICSAKRKVALTELVAVLCRVWCRNLRAPFTSYHVSESESRTPSLELSFVVPRCLPLFLADDQSPPSTQFQRRFDMLNLGPTPRLVTLMSMTP